MQGFQKDGIVRRLSQLDDDLLSLYGPHVRFELVIVGGSALMMRELALQERFTTDIDVLKASSEIEGLLERYDMNTNVSTFLYKFPENWEQRRVQVPFEGQVLDVYTLSHEDLAITKLLAGRAADKADLDAMRASGKLDMDRLQSILDDAAEVRINLEEEEWALLMDNLFLLREGGLL
ncbi:MAG: DUF6036 family nucleotidyltransferase [Eggerthellaceae bacterium]|jgi:hypothetical protein|nr:DUF6036 family nucleotidyltransferase [Eggerthellaceae bacterium]MDR2715929.1 hypothetical protein [Coriobacteriaceae bacterium]